MECDVCKKSKSYLMTTTKIKSGNVRAQQRTQSKVECNWNVHEKNGAVKAKRKYKCLFMQVRERKLAMASSLWWDIHISYPYSAICVIQVMQLRPNNVIISSVTGEHHKNAAFTSHSRVTNSWQHYFKWKTNSKAVVYEQVLCDVKCKWYTRSCKI